MDREPKNEFEKHLERTGCAVLVMIIMGMALLAMAAYCGVDSCG